jgi:hypothetical protein
MTDDEIALSTLLEKSSDASCLREIIGFAAGRLMALETETLCNAAPGERAPNRRNHRNGYRERDRETRAGTVELRIPPLASTGATHRRNLGQVRPNCAASATFQPFWSRGAWPRRR